MDSEKIIIIADHYGIKNQLNQCIEECSELIKECSKSIRYERLTEGITEEIADVFIMINQIAYLARIPKRKLSAEIESKLDRQIERIRRER